MLTLPCRLIVCWLASLLLASTALATHAVLKPQLKSALVLVMDGTTADVLLSHQADVAAPIASITKLMTALVTLDAQLPMHEMITITKDDIDRDRASSSRLTVGTSLSRSDLLHVALMSSENRAAHALGRSYPGGVTAIVQAMNAKARLLGMQRTMFVDPTGLSSRNVASAGDLAKLVMASSHNALISRYSTDHTYTVRVGRQLLEYRNTNTLVDKPDWQIAVQKTGYINEAGKCLVMQAMIAGRSVVIVLLDSYGKYTRVADARRIKQWMESERLVAKL